MLGFPNSIARKKSTHEFAHVLQDAVWEMHRLIQNNLQEQSMSHELEIILLTLHGESSKLSSNFDRTSGLYRNDG